ncbi:hypothetical protein BC941DRAFT_475181 [Chlamydoabsidia padenii]|nr:hypothetical protein BC941DRAFT_475181 [Chlamydoabsidia padenii]
MGGIFNTGRPQARGRGRGIPSQRPLSMLQRQQQQRQQQQPQAIPYNDFQLLSCSRGGTKTNMIDFKDSHRVINMAEFSQPVKLHRKDYYRIQQQQQQNKLGMNDKNGSMNTTSNDASTSSPSKLDIKASSSSSQSTPPQQQRFDKYQQQGPKTGADTSLIAPMGGATKNKQMLFKKRTKQIYLAKEDTRELKEQEHKPWILEDFNGTNSFTGTLEGGQRSDYVLFILTDNGFKVVPLDRWYKFQRKRHIRTLTGDEVEEQLKKERKQAKNEGTRWMMLKRDEEDLGDNFSPKSRLKTVDTGDSRRMGSDDEGGGKRHDSDIDDLDFDDVFQDDEEGGNDHEMEDEDIKDGKERIKKEHKGYSPNQEDAADMDDMKLTSEGKQMRKLVRNLEKNRAYESDDDKDPYATSEEELETDSGDNEDNEEGSDKESKDKDKQPQETSKSTPSLKKKNPTMKPGLKKGLKKKESMSRPIGRPGSPSIKRELSSTTPARGSLSPVRSGSSSPKESSPSPTHSGSVSPDNTTLKKRKVDEQDHRQLKHHRVSSPRHTQPSSSTTTGSHADDNSLITEEEVVETLRGQTMSTKDFLMRFRKRIKKNERNRDVITSLLKRVARQTVAGDSGVKMLELKPELA